jgi:hypothetical protein
MRPVSVRAPLRFAVFIAISSTTTPSAAADPQQFPDLSGYTDANYKDYLTYSAYSTTGAQFVTPGGYRCPMSNIFKASTSQIQCWGLLPGTAHNLVGLSYPGGPDKDGAQFADKDLSPTEHYQWLDGPGQWHDGTVSPDAYKPLPAHSKVTYNGETCGVDESMTACVLPAHAPDQGQPHGFVLSPNGSWTF